MATQTKNEPLRKDLVRKKILSMISELNLKPGDRLMSEKKLAKLFGVNHLTLRGAYAELAEQGILDRRHGSGTYIKSTGTGEDENRLFYHNTAQAVIIAMRDDPHFYSSLRNDIILELEKSGMVPIVIGSERKLNNENMSKLLKFHSMGIKSLIIDQSPSLDNQYNIQFLRSHGCDFEQVVRILGNQPLSDLPGKMISGDYSEAYNNAISYLKELGHSKIGFFCGTLTEDNKAWSANRRYVELYSQAMLNNFLTDGMKICTSSSVDTMRQASKELIEAGCSAIFCDIDYRALIVLETAAEMGMKVPRDLSVIGFYDTPWAKHYNMTTFRFRNKEIAKSVVHYLDHSDSTKTVLNKIDLIERNTTGRFEG